MPSGIPSRDVRNCRKYTMLLFRNTGVFSKGRMRETLTLFVFCNCFPLNGLWVQLSQCRTQTSFQVPKFKERMK